MSSNLVFSPNTLQVLSNFADLNPACCLEEGNVIRTVNASRTVLAIVKVPETIPTTFRIYNLPNFISLLKMPIFSECDIDISPEKMIIKNEKALQTFWASSESLVSLPPEGFKPEITTPDLEGTLKTESLSHVLKVVSTLKHDTIDFVSKSNRVTLVTRCKDDQDTSNTHEFVIGKTTLPDFSISVKPENLKVLPVDYNFKIGDGARGKVLLLTSQDKEETVTYMIGTNVED